MAKESKMVSEAKAQERERAAFFKGHKEGCKYTLERIHNALELDKYFQRKSN